MDPIRFYRANEEPYGRFSNLHRAPITLHGEIYATVEHAYQSLKPRDPRVRDWLLAAPAPSLLAIAAHAMPSDEPDPAIIMSRTADALLGFHTRPGWSRLRYPWMYACLRAKFTQLQAAQDLLLSTYDRPIVEAGTIDDEAGRRWGEVNGRGHNYLGRMLMRLRAELRGDEHVDQDLDDRLSAGATQLQTALDELGIARHKQAWKTAIEQYASMLTPALVERGLEPDDVLTWQPRNGGIHKLAERLATHPSFSVLSLDMLAEVKWHWDRLHRHNQAARNLTNWRQ